MMDIVIIGAGPAGRFAAMYASERGNNVTLIEEKFIGGKCLNHACMVVCALNDISRHVRDVEHFNKLGLVDSEFEVNFGKITSTVKETQKKIRKIITKETVNTGVDFVQGKANINHLEKYVVVNDEEYYYDKLLICTGATPFVPDIDGAENALTYKDILKLKEVPEKVVIVGGGSTAAEYAGIFSNLGSQVDVLCRSRFLKIIDDDETEQYIVSKLLKNTMIHENVIINEITDTCVITNFGKIDGTVILATGVKANSEIVDNIVKKDLHGNIIVDEYMQTSNEDIYAAGDVIGGIQSTPVSRMEGMVAIRNIMGEHVKPDYSLIPLTISLAYDVSYLKGEDVNNNGKTLKLPGAAGPGTFWYTLEGTTGYTKENMDIQTNTINNILSISPASNIALPYMTKMIKDNKTSMNNYVEIHPTTDGISKLTEYFKRYS